MEHFLEFAKSYIDYCVDFFGAFGNAHKRQFFGFLLASTMVAYFIFRHHKKKKEIEGGFISFLFPKTVWSSPSAWLDLRYFFFHGLIGHFLLAGIQVSATLAGLFIGMGFVGDSALAVVSPHTPVLSAIIVVSVLLVTTLIIDFMGFFLHYLQHKIPVLWQFHKVHHAGEVMHPLSNFREHPVDNLVYKLVINLVSSIALGAIWRFLGYIPSDGAILGYSVVGLTFNSAAYHLRHSHIWLRWPGNWSKIFGSPAHHHVHHSRHPDHLDKNFAFIFPIWDVLFKTYHMPETNKDVEFGIVEDSSELNSCINLYLIPFRDAYRILQGSQTKKLAKEYDTQTATT